MIAVFVIAHPDDESMFFLPTICGLHGDRTRWLLCLSNGNYDGLGKTREIELHRVGAYLGLDRVIVIDHEELQDSPRVRWPKHVIASVLDEKLPKEPLELYTFDEKGVSGHINHVDTYRGVRHYLGHRQNYSTTGTRNTKAFQLRTVVSPIQKYVPLWHWIVLLLTVLGVLRNKTPEQLPSARFTMYQPWVNWKCMASHASQFVWYRRLFVAFSCYTYENLWQPIEPISQ